MCIEEVKEEIRKRSGRCKEHPGEPQALLFIKMMPLLEKIQKSKTNLKHTHSAGYGTAPEISHFDISSFP